MLLTEQNTRKVERLVRRTARARFGRVKSPEAFFEHGQWWFRFDTWEGQRTFSVVDAFPSCENSGLEFEET